MREVNERRVVLTRLAHAAVVTEGIGAAARTRLSAPVHDHAHAIAAKSLHVHPERVCKPAENHNTSKTFVISPAIQFRCERAPVRWRSGVRGVLSKRSSKQHRDGRRLSRRPLLGASHTANQLGENPGCGDARGAASCRR